MIFFFEHYAVKLFHFYFDYLKLVVMPRRHFITFIDISVVSKKKFLPLFKHLLHYLFVAVVAILLAKNHGILRAILVNMPWDIFSTAPANLLTDLELQNFAFHSIVELLEDANVAQFVFDEHLGSTFVDIAIDMEIRARMRGQMLSELMLLEFVLDLFITFLEVAVEWTA